MQMDMYLRTNLLKVQTDIITCPTSPVLHTPTDLSNMAITDITLLQTDAVQPGETAGYSVQVPVQPSMADITTSEVLQDV